MEYYHEIFPTSQNDLLSKFFSLFAAICFEQLRQITLFNSGMGSGKSNIMASVHTALHDFAGILFVLEKNDHLKKQIRAAFSKKGDAKMKFVDLNECSVRIIEILLRQGYTPVVFAHNVAHSKGCFNAQAKKLENLLKAFPNENKLVLVDELDSQLTSLTGGINSKLDRTSELIKNHFKVIDQKESLNVFDLFRKHKVKCIGFSGTMNNMICSKLPSMGYDKEDISIINVYPIRDLYKDLDIVPTDVHNFQTIAPYLEKAEACKEKKVLVVVPDEKSITDFKRKFNMHFGKTISCVKITGSNQKYRNKEEFMKELAEAKYVFGINMVTTGFDISTWVENTEFSVGVLWRVMSDKISQPLSKNAEHALHMDTSSSLMQLFARLRKGGVFLVPSKLDGRNLFDRLVEVFAKIRDGGNEYDWVGGKSYVSQEERENQCLVLNLLQNLKEENRPIVDGIVKDLKYMTGQDFESDAKDRDSFNHEAWMNAMGYLWKMSAIDLNIALSSEEKMVNKAELIEEYKGAYLSGGGFKKPRLTDEEKKEQIRERSREGEGYACCYCGELFENIDVPQDCHVRRHNKDGEYSLDNIMRGHSGCDSIFDNDGLILFDKDMKSVWLRRAAKNFNPHRKQLRGISLENFSHRWDWEKNRQQQAHLSDDDYKKYLTNKGFICKQY